MKSVCIIGAGPAGLSAAKTFLQSGQFSVTVYDRQHKIGGIWSVTQGDETGFLDPETPTNLSRWCIAFSGLDWKDVDLSRGESTAPNHPAAIDGGYVPVYPRAWQVNRYLEAYRRKFIPDGIIKLGVTVTAAEHVGRSAGGLEKGAKSWNITTETDGVSTTTSFDRLVIASGFYSGITKPPALVAANINAIHSSRFRRLSDLFPHEAAAKGKDIMVVGCGNSASETAAAIALQMSNARWTYGSDTYETSKIIHVTPRKLWACPRFLRNAAEQSFLPGDFKFWDLGIRPEGLVKAAVDEKAPEVSVMVNEYLENCTGSDQADLSEALGFDDDARRRPPYSAIADRYPEFVRSGMVRPVIGRMVGISGDSTAHAEIQDNSGRISIIENIGALVYATGYGQHDVLEMLDEDTKKRIRYDRDSPRMPVILQQWQTMSSQVPELGFVGFMESPVTPLLELQAEVLAQTWSDDTFVEHIQEANRESTLESVEKLLAIRNSIRAGRDVAQYWFDDFSGYMEEIARELRLDRNDSPLASPREGHTIAARYKARDATPVELEVNDRLMRDYAMFRQSCLRDGAYIPRVVFFALQGDWNISRRIESTNAHLSGSLEGTASFHPRLPSHSTSSPDEDREVEFEQLYTEQGDFTSPSTGISMKATRRYVYRYSDVKDMLSVWFVAPDDKRGLKTDYLFHNLKFAPPIPRDRSASFTASADHLCVKDMYTTRYKFPMKGTRLQEFEIEHSVKGPGKDYVATTRYWRT